MNAVLLRAHPHQNACFFQGGERHFQNNSFSLKKVVVLLCASPIFVINNSNLLIFIFVLLWFVRFIV